MKSGKKRKCIFLDRDGTINQYIELLSKVEDFKLEEGAAKAIRCINQSEYLCIVISNQPVVARNLCTYEEAWEINKKMEALLKEEGAYLDDIFICPHHPHSGYEGENKEYKIECSCRKPKIGMIQEAKERYNIDLTDSYIIGDTTIDIQTGKNSGLKTVLVKTGLGGTDGTFKVEPDFYAENLYQAVIKIVGSKSNGF